MRPKSTCVFVLVSMAMAGIGVRSARAQDSDLPAPLSRPLTLEFSGPTSGIPKDRSAGAIAPDTGPRTGEGRAATKQVGGPIRGQSYAATGQQPAATGMEGGRSVAATPQSLDSRRIRSRSALARLANPFDGGTVPGPYGARVPAKANSAPVPIASEQRSGNAFLGGNVAGPTPQAPAGGMPGAAAQAEAGAIAGGAPAPGGTESVPGTTPLPSATTADAANPNLTTPITPDTFGEAGTGAGAGFGGTLGATATPFAMIGDIAPFSTHAVTVNPPGPPPPPGQRGGSPIYPSVRNFKISENQSPRPQDRIFFDFNYYNNLNDTVNLRDLSPITQLKAYVYNFGIEKTFNNGMGSIGIRVPLDNLTGNSFNNIVSTPTSTALGNMTIFSKYILAQNTQTGSLISAAWAISPQTATGRFAGAPYLFPLNSTNFQTCLGYIYNYNKWYLQGFSGISASMNPNDVSFIYNDVGVGYFVIRNQDSRAWLTALAPTFELHVNNPVNHRDVFNKFDLAGSADSVDLTFGLNFGIRNAAVLTLAYVTPVSSPKPFDSEATVMLNIFFGRTRRTIPITPPPL